MQWVQPVIVPSGATSQRPSAVALSSTNLPVGPVNVIRIATVWSVGISSATVGPSPSGSSSTR